MMGICIADREGLSWPLLRTQCINFTCVTGTHVVVAPGQKWFDRIWHLAEITETKWHWQSCRNKTQTITPLIRQACHLLASLSQCNRKNKKKDSLFIQNECPLASSSGNITSWLMVPTVIKPCLLNTTSISRSQMWPAGLEPRQKKTATTKNSWSYFSFFLSYKMTTAGCFSSYAGRGWQNCFIGPRLGESAVYGFVSPRFEVCVRCVKMCEWTVTQSACKSLK